MEVDADGLVDASGGEEAGCQGEDALGTRRRGVAVAGVAAAAGRANRTVCDLVVPKAG